MSDQYDEIGRQIVLSTYITEMTTGDIAKALAAAIRARVQAERKACAEIVVARQVEHANGRSTKDILLEWECAAIAAAIEARGDA